MTSLNGVSCKEDTNKNGALTDQQKRKMLQQVEQQQADFGTIK
jgi:hypothetical protein